MVKKGGRKKRLNNRDFQKVKLRVGKKKPQAENFTVTTFKSQSVRIRDQLKADRDASEPSTQRKQNVNDLLGHLNHYNVAMRQSSISGMKELLSTHPALIGQHLPQLVDSLSVLMTDREDSVRKSGISLIHLVLKATPADRIVPFFPVLAAHLSCAMTHIAEPVRVDSLAVLDSLLTFYPRMLTAPGGRCGELLAVFVQQISQQGKKKASWSATAKTATTRVEGGSQLLVKPESTMSSHRWRQQVLSRLRRFLSALLDNYDTKHALKRDPSTEAFKTVNVNGTDKSSVVVFASGAQARGYREEFTLGTGAILASTAASSQDISQPDDLLAFIRTLVPLLIQCWMEVAPRLPGQAAGHLSAVAVEILDGVLSVIQLLWRWLHRVCEEKQESSCTDRLRTLYQKTFISRLLSCFPYTARPSAPKTKRMAGMATVPTTTTTEVSMVGLNLATCEVMSYFVGRGSAGEAWMRKVMAFLLETAVDGRELTAGNICSLLGVIRRIAKVLPKQEVNDLHQVVYTLYDSCHPLSRNKCETLTCLDELMPDEGSDSSSSSVISLLLQSLPPLLLRLRGRCIETSRRALAVLSRRASQRQARALECVQENIKSFVDPDDGILTRLPDDLQMSVIRLVHHVKPVDGDLLRSLALCCHRNQVSGKTVSCLVNMLSTRFLDASTSEDYEDRLPFSLADFISFLFSVSIGFPQSALSVLPDITCQTPGLSDPRCLTSVAVAYVLAEVDLGRHRTIVKSVCLSYGLVCSHVQIWGILQTLIANLLRRPMVLPYPVAYAILRTTDHLGTPHAHWSRESTDKLTDCCLASMHAATGADDDGEFSAFVDNGWHKAVWEASIDVLVKSDALLAALIERLQTRIKDMVNCLHIQFVATVLIRLLQNPRLVSKLQQMAECVQRVVQSVLAHPRASEATQWKAELQYEASVILKTATQNPKNSL